MILSGFPESRLSASAAFRVCGLKESERKAGFFVTGWRSRESFGRPSRRIRHGYRRSEDHSQRLARDLSGCYGSKAYAREELIA